MWNRGRGNLRCRSSSSIALWPRIPTECYLEYYFIVRFWQAEVVYSRLISFKDQRPLVGCAKVSDSVSHAGGVWAGDSRGLKVGSAISFAT